MFIYQYLEPNRCVEYIKIYTPPPPISTPDYAIHRNETNGGKKTLKSVKMPKNLTPVTTKQLVLCDAIDVPPHDEPWGQ